MDRFTAEEKQRGRPRESVEVIRIRIGFNLCVAPSKHVSSLFGSRGNSEEQRLSRKTEVDIQTLKMESHVVVQPFERLVSVACNLHVLFEIPGIITVHPAHFKVSDVLFIRLALTYRIMFRNGGNPYSILAQNSLHTHNYLFHFAMSRIVVHQPPYSSILFSSVMVTFDLQLMVGFVHGL